MSLRLRCSEAPVVGFGARLQAAERLIRLGARASVVVDALLHAPVLTLGAAVLALALLPRLIRVSE